MRPYFLHTRHTVEHYFLANWAQQVLRSHNILLKMKKRDSCCRYFFDGRNFFSIEAITT